MTENEFKYWAFLSYSQQDNRENRSGAQAAGSRCWGDWLHDALTTFSIPAEFVGQINGRGEIIPERIDPLFRHEPKLADEANLSADVRKALDQSRCLIVICSPRSTKNVQVNEAVRYFKQLGRSNHILPIVIAGEPNASNGNNPGMSPEEECLVPALRHPVQSDGTIDTDRRAGRYVFVDARRGVDKQEVAANDHRAAKADLEMVKIQLIALLLGVGFNGLWWREQQRHFFDLAEAQHQVREALNQVEEVRRQLQEAQRQTREAQNKALEMQNLPGDVQGQIQEAQNQVQTAQHQTREAQKQLQEFQNKVRDAQTQLAEARHRAIAAESKVLEAQNQAREIQNELDASRKQTRAAQNPPAQFKETRPPVQAGHDQLLAAQTQVQEFQNQARLAQSQLEEARQLLQKTPGEGRNARRLTKVFALLAVLALLAAGIALRQRKVASQALAQPAAGEIWSPDLAQSELNREQLQQLLQNIGGAAQHEKQRRSLDYLAASIPTAQIPEVLKASAVIVEDQPRSHFQKWLLVRLGWANPELAMTNASAIDGKILTDAGLSDSCAYFQLAVLDNWLKTDFPGAFSWACRLPDSDSRQRALEKIVNGLQSQPNSDSKIKIIENGIEQLAKTDVPGALALAESLGVWWRSPVVTRLWMKADPLAFWGWINHLNFPPEIMQLRNTPWVLRNANFGGPKILPVEMGIFLEATNAPIPIKPEE